MGEINLEPAQNDNQSLLILQNGKIVQNIGDETLE